MKVREDVADLLRAGVPQIQIARRLHVGQITVQRTREALGIPSTGAGCRPTATTFAEALHAHTEPTDDGHIRWTGHVDPQGSPRVQLKHDKRSAYRVAFVLHYGREPVGRVTPTCRMQGCVRGDHMADQAMRQQPRPPRFAATVEEAFLRRVRPVDGGHMEWAGSRNQYGTPVMKHGGRAARSRTAHQIAFHIQYGREAEGQVLPGCGMAGCVAPAHVEDQAMRNRYAAIFGGAS